MQSQSYEKFPCFVYQSQCLMHIQRQQPLQYSFELAEEVKLCSYFISKNLINQKFTIKWYLGYCANTSLKNELKKYLQLFSKRNILETGSLNTTWPLIIWLGPWTAALTAKVEATMLGLSGLLKILVGRILNYILNFGYYAYPKCGIQINSCYTSKI